MINFQIYKTHIKPQKPALIKPIKPAGLGFMIKPGFYANPDPTHVILPRLSCLDCSLVVLDGTYAQRYQVTSMLC